MGDLFREHKVEEMAVVKQKIAELNKVKVRKTT